MQNVLVAINEEGKVIFTVCEDGDTYDLIKQAILDEYSCDDTTRVSCTEPSINGKHTETWEIEIDGQEEMQHEIITFHKTVIYHD